MSTLISTVPFHQQVCEKNISCNCNDNSINNKSLTPSSPASNQIVPVTGTSSQRSHTRYSESERIFIQSFTVKKLTRKPDHRVDRKVTAISNTTLSVKHVSKAGRKKKVGREEVEDLLRKPLSSPGNISNLTSPLEASNLELQDLDMHVNTI